MLFNDVKAYYLLICWKSAKRPWREVRHFSPFPFFCSLFLTLLDSSNIYSLISFCEQRWNVCHFAFIFSVRTFTPHISILTIYVFIFQLRYQKCLDAHPQGLAAPLSNSSPSKGIGATIKNFVGSITGRKQRANSVESWDQVYSLQVSIHQTCIIFSLFILFLIELLVQIMFNKCLLGLTKRWN